MIKNNVWNEAIDAAWYDHKRHNRPKTFGHVTRLIQSDNVGTLLEVGGGTGYFAPLVHRYINVELNDTVEQDMLRANQNSQLVAGDFMDIDLSPFIGDIDMVLALSVVQHVPHYREFFQRALLLRPATVVVSFFGPMREGGNLIQKKREYKDLTFRFGHTSYLNVYSRQLIARHLDRLPETLGRYRFKRIVELPRGGHRREETVLTIRPRYLEDAT